MLKTQQDYDNEAMFRRAAEDQRRAAQRAQDDSKQYWEMQRRKEQKRQKRREAKGIAVPQEARKPSRVVIYLVCVAIWVVWLVFVNQAVRPGTESFATPMLVFACLISIPNLIWMRLGQALLLAALAHFPIVLLLMGMEWPIRPILLLVLPLLYGVIGVFKIRR